jgi:hypothetical protein
MSEIKNEIIKKIGILSTFALGCATEVGNLRYILDLLLCVIHVSVQTVELASQLPKLKFE